MTVRVTRDEVARFKRTWPCSGLPNEASITFEYSYGDLVDVTIRKGGRIVDGDEYDGPALVALANDAQDGKIGRQIA